jgi:hypothetical protein
MQNSGSTPESTSAPAEQLSELQFDHAETEGHPGSPSCALCRATLAEQYHQLNGSPICATCRAREEERFRADTRSSRFLVAAGYGFGAALLGSVLYWGFSKITGIEFALMAVAVGWLVGKSVMKGSNYRGGRKYQILAVLLTYFSITFSYTPFLFEAAAKQRTANTKTGKSVEKSAAEANSTPPPPSDMTKKAPRTGTIAVAFGMLFLIILAAPFLAGAGNFMGWVIIAIGLWEAWKFTRPIAFLLSGPYSLSDRKPE